MRSTSLPDITIIEEKNVILFWNKKKIKKLAILILTHHWKISGQCVLKVYVNVYMLHLESALNSIM